MVELGNAIFGNSRGRHEVDRALQDEWYSYMEALGFDGYGHHDAADERGIFENDVFRVQPYYWDDCECDYEEKEGVWSKANSHGAECYQTELRGRLRAWEIENGYDAVKRRAYGDNTDPFFRGFDVTTEEPMPGMTTLLMEPRTDDAIKALRAMDDKRSKREESICTELCKRHKLSRKYGWGVHCTCDFEARWAVFLETNSHAPECRTATPNFTHKPSGFTLQWYKYPLRDSYSSAPLTRELMRSMWSDCAASVDTLPEGQDHADGLGAEQG